MSSVIERCSIDDFEGIWKTINEGAQAYAGQIPDDRLKEPYMSQDELRHEIASGVTFWGAKSEGELLAVMGIQDVLDVTLIRHAYVRTAHQRGGLGSGLLAHLRVLTTRPILIGTWADAVWAIAFYQRHGFRIVSQTEKDSLLRKYWQVPDRQIETSIVLAGESWPELGDG